MSEQQAATLIRVEQGDDFVTLVELCNPPFNFFELGMVQALGDAFDRLDADPACRAIVLAAAGQAFCAGANFGDGRDTDNALGGAPAQGEVATGSGFSFSSARLYEQAVRLFGNRKPIVAAIHGAAIGGGLGLALVADFRVTCPQARFSANFTQLGIHPGFGLTHTLPALIGPQRAQWLFYTGGRIKGDEAVAIGLADRLVEQDQVRDTARAMAREIAAAAPLAVVSLRQALRMGLAEQVRAATQREQQEQAWLIQTADAREGMSASFARRTPRFEAR